MLCLLGFDRLSGGKSPVPLVPPYAPFRCGTVHASRCNDHSGVMIRSHKHLCGGPRVPLGIWMLVQCLVREIGVTSVSDG